MNIMTDDVCFSLVPYRKVDCQKDSSAQAGIESDLHLHSTFSDGHNIPQDIVERAITLGYKAIGITEHVRRTTDWLDAFAEEMERLKQVYVNRIRLYSGIEAKVINLKGDVDACPEFFTKVDLVLGAFHRIPKGQDEYLGPDEISRDKDKALEYWFNGMTKLLENDNVHVIAHPTSILKTHGISVPYELKNVIAQRAAAYHKVFEVNPKYQVPDEEFLHLLELNKVRFSFGSDSHRVEEM
ncbi:PHP domain-containing protein [Chloroflexota bacterium]